MYKKINSYLIMVAVIEVILLLLASSIKSDAKYWAEAPASHCFYYGADIAERYETLSGGIMDGSNSGMDYVVVLPEDPKQITRAQLVLLGNGDVNVSPDTIFRKYQFTTDSQDTIIIIPIPKKQSDWVNQQAALETIICEVYSQVLDEYGISIKDSLYISGFSAGADAMTTLVERMSNDGIEFAGAVYVAGHIDGYRFSEADENTFVSLWEGKKVFYFRDAYYGNGGYGYNACLCSNLESRLAGSFVTEALPYNHRAEIVDAAMAMVEF